MKSTYWSCSKFVDWLRGTPKLSSGTAEEWRTWKIEAKSKPFRYWLAEDGLDHMQDTLCWPINRMKTLRDLLTNSKSNIKLFSKFSNWLLLKPTETSF